jgi:nitroreductase/NAD-dependent dihydropyrimidine dehydrogenase PreA subunit
MEMLNVIESECKSCGLCAKICPMNIIALNDTGHPYKRTGGADCMDCGHCAAICPEGAILSSAARTKKEESDNRTESGSGGDFLSFMKNRRSCRAFLQKDVPQRLIDQALDAARYAPSAKNTQPVEWTVIADTGAIQSLAMSLYKKGRSNPELAKRYAFVEADEDPVFRGAPVLVVVHSDPKNVLFPGDGIIAAATFDLAAQALGLGTCWSGTAYSAADEVRKAARLPEGHNLHAVFMLGFPAQAWRRQPDRKEIRIHRI